MKLHSTLLSLVYRDLCVLLFSVHKFHFLNVANVFVSFYGHNDIPEVRELNSEPQNSRSSRDNVVTITIKKRGDIIFVQGLLELYLNVYVCNV